MYFNVRWTRVFVYVPPTLDATCSSLGLNVVVV